MPIVDNHVEYEIPPEIDEKIPEYFYLAMAGELCSIFGVDIFVENEDGDYPISYVSSTGGWYGALWATCEKLDLVWFREYWDALEWYDSDILDGIIEDRIIEKFIESKKSDGPNIYYRHLIQSMHN